ncbi:hypothetical protein PAPYR_5469 [Paratrimastix pyriformis]|uniref:Uncharacterized protein n=1 Tax=Paratrimastix pyriformis TaxID=342808 RepID=A0ABQ8UKG2_9EUKA|nr:hypothetical protein PAPYR_5469 [Paratrimastix pyriformis]
MAKTLQLSGLASGDVYSTNGGIMVVANRDRTGFEAFNETPGYAFDATHFLSVAGGTGWVAGKRFTWGSDVIDVSAANGTPQRLIASADGALSITSSDAESVWTGNVGLLTFLITSAEKLVTNDYLTTVETSPLCMSALDRAVGCTLSSDFAASIASNGTVSLSPYTISYRGISVTAATSTTVSEIHNFAFTGGVWSVPQISSGVVARTSAGAVNTNFSVHLLGLMPCASGPIVIDLLSPNAFTAAPEAAIAIDNRATSVQFVGTLGMMHVAPFMWVILNNATGAVETSYPIRPPSAPSREKLVLTMNDLSDTMFTSSGGTAGRIYRPDATHTLVANSIGSEAYTSMTSALKLLYGAYTAGYIQRASDGTLTMTPGVAAASTANSIMLRDANGGTSLTRLYSTDRLRLFLFQSFTTCGISYGANVAGDAMDGVGTPPACTPLSMTGLCVRIKTGSANAGTA